MTKQQKILTTTAWGLLVVLMVGIVVSRQRPQSDVIVADIAASQPHSLFSAPAFSLLDQDAKRFGSDDLKGKVWVAQFIFTHCAGPCPMMLGKMKHLNTQVTDPNIHLVTFTVDPERDTPAVLKEKAQELGADSSRWHFLTGSKDEIDAVAQGMLTMTRAPGDDQHIMHSELFFLIDGAGNCRGLFSSNDETRLQQLREKAASLVAERGAQ